MRHRRKGRRLGRSASHRKAMLRNMASSLFLTERDAELDDNQPKTPGRIVTTMPKAKEVRPLVERCITIARHSLKHQADAERYATDAERGSDAWKTWRSSEDYAAWNAKMAPTVAARRRVLQMLGDRQAVGIVFEKIAPRFADRPGGYTRILKLAEPRLGDAGRRVILEFVGVHDRVATRAEKPAFDTDADESGGAAVAAASVTELGSESAEAEPATDATATEEQSVQSEPAEQEAKSAEAKSAEGADESAEPDAEK